MSQKKNTDKRGPERKAAERIYLENGGDIKQAEIATRLNVPAGRIRKWKSLDKWDDQLEEKPPGKVGAPYGNQNAKGGRGNPHPNPPPDRTTHGAYRSVILDQLTDDEKELMEGIPNDPEKLIMDEIRFLMIRERRLLMAIQKYQSPEIKMVVSDVIRRESKRSFANAAEAEEYKKRVEKKVSAGDRLPGEGYQQEEHMTNADLILVRLSQELSTVQGKIIKAVDTLHKIRMDRQKLETITTASESVDEWITALLSSSE